MSAIEIYNEVVRDMLVDDSEALRVLDDPDRGPVVEGLTEIVITSLQHFEDLMRDVETRRQVAATRLNELSSRSHTIVRLYVESSAAPRRSATDGEDETIMSPLVVVSTLNFVDLAGSERSSISGLQDSDERQRLKEVIAVVVYQLRGAARMHIGMSHQPQSTDTGHSYPTPQ